MATLREVSRGIDNNTKAKPNIAAVMRSRLDEISNAYAGRIVAVDEEIALE